MNVTLFTSKEYTQIGPPTISMRAGHPINTTFWAPEENQAPLLAVIQNWDSDAVPLWVLVTGVRFVLTGFGLLDAHKEYDRTDHAGGIVPGSFDHDFARLGLAKGAERFEVTR